MDGFTYTNIFETKGIEYLAIITFLVLLIPFWLLLNRKVRTARKFQRAAGALSPGILRIPQGLFYSPNHTWTHLETSGIARLGLDDLLLHITGEVKFGGLKKPGEEITKGDLLAKIYHQGKSLDIFSPISGKITGVNSELNEDPLMQMEDPYGRGWIYAIKPSKWMIETSYFFMAGEASSWAKRELDRFKDFLAWSAMKYYPEPSLEVMQDGGELQDHTLSEMPVEIWKDFQDNFLKIPTEQQ